MKFKVHLLKSKNADPERAPQNLSDVINYLRLKYQVARWGLSYALAGEVIAKVRLNRRSVTCRESKAYSYELDMLNNDYRTMMDLFFGKVKKQLALAGVGLVSFVALLGIGGGKVEASQQILNAPSVSKESTKTSNPAISHAAIDSYLQEAFPGEYASEKFQLAYYHNNISHVNTGETHVNNPHSDVSGTHTNTWTNAQTHQNTWNNIGHQNTPPDAHQNSPGGVHSNIHSNTIPGDYIY